MSDVEDPAAEHFRIATQPAVRHIINEIRVHVTAAMAYAGEDFRDEALVMQRVIEFTTDVNRVTWSNRQWLQQALGVGANHE